MVYIRSTLLLLRISSKDRVETVRKKSRPIIPVGRSSKLSMFGCHVLSDVSIAPADEYNGCY